MDAIPSPPPHSISLGGLRTPALGVRRATFMGPASENLHNSSAEADIAQGPKTCTTAEVLSVFDQPGVGRKRAQIKSLTLE